MADDSLKTKISDESHDSSKKLKVAQPFSSLCYHYFNVFCYCTYRLLLFPFKFSIKENDFRLESNQFQKALCLLLNILMIIISFLNFRLSVPVIKIRDNPAIMYQFAYKAAEIFYVVVFTYTGFYKRDSFLNVLKISLGCQHTMQKTNNARTKETYVAAILYAIAMLPPLGPLLVQCFQKSFSTLMKNSFADMQYVLFLQNTKEVTSDGNMNALSTILTCCYIMLAMVANFVIQLVELLFYLGSFSVWKIVSEFTQESLKHIHSKSTDQIIINFDIMKKLLSAVNCATGACVLVVFVDSVPYFSNRVIDFIDGTHWYDRLDYFHYLVLHSISFIYAAEANKKMEDYKELLFKSARNNVECDSKLYNLLLEMSSTSYGLKGCGFFTITYGFLGSALSLFITYTIVMLQFRRMSV